MASIANDPGGRRRIQFVDIDGKRKAIRVGKMSLRDAESIARHVEALLVTKKSAQPIASHTATWLPGIADDLHAKLAAVGLIASRGTTNATLGDFVENYIARRTDVKPATLINWRHAKRCLITYFGEDRAISSITSAEARDWERWLKTGTAREHRYGTNEAESGLAANTVRKRVSNAKQFFQDAVERELIARNPFAGMKGAVSGNRERDFFITRKMAAKVLEACPNDEWRLLFALSRYGGLRCPSEHLELRWRDIDWEQGRMTIRSPKTERHEGKASRVIPIFPELRPYLDAVFHAAEPGTVFVISRRRDARVNLRTHLERIIQRAGLTPWPKLWQNLRASRATELAAEHPAHVAAAWLGHSTLIAQKHYWQVTDEDFDKATGESTVRRAAHNAAQQAHVSSSIDSHERGPAHEKPPEMRVSATLCDTTHSGGMGDTGCEHPASFSGKTQSCDEGGAESGALGARPPQVDPELVAIVDAWPKLADAVKAHVLALIRGNSRTSDAK